MSQIVPIAVPGVHERFIKYFMKLMDGKKDAAILDIGSGHGYLVKKLHEDGFNVQAADLFPEYYRYDKVPCVKADISKPLPFADNSFDVLIAVEVMEHVQSHPIFFAEAVRVLRPNGMLLFTTPNIVSLKSRFRFLLSGFFYAFTPLDDKRSDGLQHIASLTPDQYRYTAMQAGFTSMTLDFDKKQKSSLWLMFMVPFNFLYCKLKNIPYKLHNNTGLLTGRVLFVGLRK